MTTSNIISTPNIEGNIGSCTIQSNSVKTFDRIFTADYTTTQINSCTGKVIGNYNYTDYSFVWLSIFIGAVLLVCFGMSAISSNSY